MKLRSYLLLLLALTIASAVLVVQGCGTTATTKPTVTLKGGAV